MASVILQKATETVQAQIQHFGNILTQQVIPQLKQNSIYPIYEETIPAIIKPATQEFFFSQLLAFLQPIELTGDNLEFFPENNKLYLAAVFERQDEEHTAIVNVPSGHVPRFFMTEERGNRYIVFIDDIIKENLSFIFSGATIKGAYSFKITRDAELDLQDEYEGDIADKIEKQIVKRDQGFATRFLYSPGMPDHFLQQLIAAFNLSSASVVQGGVYHNLKDLSSFPAKEPSLCYPKWMPVKKKIISPQSLFSSIALHDIVLHTPYHDYGLVLRFFNEAAISKDVEEIYVTLYRIAGDSRIGNALISAAKNGKSVTVFVELKARFDEANNIRWAKENEGSGCQDHL